MSQSSIVGGAVRLCGGGLGGGGGLGVGHVLGLTLLATLCSSLSVLLLPCHCRNVSPGGRGRGGRFLPATSRSGGPADRGAQRRVSCPPSGYGAQRDRQLPGSGCTCEKKVSISLSALSSSSSVACCLGLVCRRLCRLFGARSRAGIE